MEMPLDFLHDTLKICQNIVIPKAEDKETLAVEPCCPFCILFPFNRILTSVSFNDQTSFITDEVYDKSADLFLPPEFQASHLFCSQATPEKPFGICRGSSQFFCRISQDWRLGHSPSPLPPPIKGGGTLWAIYYSSTIPAFPLPSVGEG
jgi:hypothetical protein